MANLVGLAKALNERLPYKKEQQDRILKQLLTKEELASFDEGFYVVQNGEVKKVQGNATRSEFRFIALGMKLVVETPKFMRGFYIFYPEQEELTLNSPLLVLRQFGYRFFNDVSDAEVIPEIANKFLRRELGLEKEEVES
ncbi:hypothetical protein [Kurthia massiliensis]|uniref:hypothetical protein n=1 Tax=Kurthia massiliensis TaxID=1033739 RepID=UPI0002898582|nr:hypothetical protein [Kurthia massiliensis]